jgi:hypothetical protein
MSLMRLLLLTFSTSDLLPTLQHPSPKAIFPSLATKEILDQSCWAGLLWLLSCNMPDWSPPVNPQPLVSPIFACSVTHTIAFAAKSGDDFEAPRDEDGSLSNEARAGEHFGYAGVLITNTPVFADYSLVCADDSLVCALMIRSYVLMIRSYVLMIRSYVLMIRPYVLIIRSYVL